MSKPHTVIVTLEAQQGKEKALESALESLVEYSRSEQTCLEYRLHRNIENASQFILYEIWESKEKHQEQFAKPYIIEFASRLGDLITESYQAIYAERI